MNITVKLDDNVDLTFFKKMLSQIKGVREIIVDDEQEVIEKAIEKSRNQIKNGQYEEYSKKLTERIFQE